MSERESRLEKALDKILIWSGEAMKMDAPSPVRGLLDAIFDAADHGIGYMPTSTVRRIIDQPQQTPRVPDRRTVSSLFELYAAALSGLIARDTNQAGTELAEQAKRIALAAMATWESTP